MKKKLLASIITLCMVLIALPMGVMAAENAADPTLGNEVTYVDGGDVSNGLDLTAPPDVATSYTTEGGGSLLYTPASGDTPAKLELNKATITRASEDSPAPAIEHNGDLTITLVGDSKVTSTTYFNSGSLDVVGNLVIEGDGSLTAYGEKCAGIYVSRDLTVAADATINSTNKANLYSGVKCQGKLTVGGNVTTEGHKYAFDATDVEVLAGGVLDAKEYSISTNEPIVNGTLNAFVKIGESKMVVYGNKTIVSYFNSEGCPFIVESGAVLTIDEGVELQLENLEDLVIKGQIINNGKILLPDATTGEQIKGLKLTGTGVVHVGSDQYKNDGTLIFFPHGTMDFTDADSENIGDLEQLGFFWEYTSKTLTIKNLTVELQSGGAAIRLPDGATLVVQGTNKLKADDGIVSEGTLNILSDTGGTMIFECNSEECYCNGICSDGDLTIGGNVKVGITDAGDDGIYSDGNVTIGDNAQVDITDAEGAGIYSEGNVTIGDNAQVDIVDSLGDGIYSEGNEVAIGGNAVVYVAVDEAEDCICGNSVVIGGNAKVTVVGAEDGICGTSVAIGGSAKVGIRNVMYGIVVEEINPDDEIGDLTINGDAIVTVAGADDVGIYSEGGLTINDNAAVTVDNAKMGINSDEIAIGGSAKVSINDVGCGVFAGSMNPEDLISKLTINDNAIVTVDDAQLGINSREIAIGGSAKVSINDVGCGVFAGSRNSEDPISKLTIDGNAIVTVDKAEFGIISNETAIGGSAKVSINDALCGVLVGLMNPEEQISKLTINDNAIVTVDRVEMGIGGSEIAIGGSAVVKINNPDSVGISSKGAMTIDGSSVLEIAVTKVMYEEPGVGITTDGDLTIGKDANVTINGMNGGIQTSGSFTNGGTLKINSLTVGISVDQDETPSTISITGGTTAIVTTKPDSAAMVVVREVSDAPEDWKSVMKFADGYLPVTHDVGRVVCTDGPDEFVVFAVIPAGGKLTYDKDKDDLNITGAAAAVTLTDLSTPPSGGGGSSSSNITPKPEVPKTDPVNGNTEVLVPVKSVTKGDIASATVSEQAVSDAIAAGTKEAEKTGGTSSVTVTVDAPKGAKTVETTLSGKSLAAVAEGKTEGLKISTPVAEVSFDSEALAAIAKAAGKDVKITIDQVDSSKLTETQKSQVGDAPVFDLTITSDGKTISDFAGGVATVSVPYTPKAGENPEFITVWLLDDTGKLIPIEAKYADGKITFETKHFSRYAIGYLPFADVNGHWAYENIVYANQNGLFSGVGESKFAPNETMTRAMLWTVLYRMAGTPDKTAAPAIWYGDAQKWVIAQNISDGSNPAGNVTREELATSLYRYAKAAATKADMSIFTDTAKISVFAKDGMNWAVANKILQGAGGKLNPQGNATRAEVAAMLQRFIAIK